METRNCNTFECPDDCIVASWGSWGDCSLSCSDNGAFGSQTRTRALTQPEHGGKECPVSVDTQACNTHSCPIDCVLGEWQGWGDCSGSCAVTDGMRAATHCADDEHDLHEDDASVLTAVPTQTRTRSATTLPNYGGQPCGTTTDTQQCNTQACPEDCLYGDVITHGCKSHDASFGWGEWSECSKTCGTGTQSRSRTTTAPSNGGKACESDRDYQSCNTFSCPIDCEVGAWSDFDSCTYTCNGGFQTRTRTTVAAEYGGVACPTSEDTVSCNTFACPVDCIQGSWSSWSDCTLTCDTGSQTRTRSTDRATLHGGVACGSTQETQNCNSFSCPEDCVHGEWGEWGACSVFCYAKDAASFGSQTRTRQLTPPKNGGKECEESFMDQSCNTHNCPEPCVVGDWSSWGDCGKTCGGALETRTRELTAPKYGGEECPPNSFEQQECNNFSCPEDCVVGTWSDYSTCDLSCDSGSQTRTRSLGQPNHGGKACPHGSESQACNTQSCPVDCVVGEFVPGACSLTCHLGTRLWSASFTTEPQFGGKSCTAALNEIGGEGNPRVVDENNLSAGAQKGPLQCVESVICPVHCEVSQWTEWGQCLDSYGDYKSCGGGSKTRTREITQQQAGAGTACPDLTDTLNCDTDNCPIDCLVSSWSDWGSCSATCGMLNTQTRTRTVTRNSHPTYGGVACPILSEDRACNVFECPVDGHYPQGWGEWSECSLTCGSGTKTRTRLCTEPTNGGAPCEEPRSESQPCNQFECPVDCVVGNFGSWSTCTKSCETGSQTRTRSVTTPAAYGGVACEHLSESQNCNTQCCPVDCFVQAWGAWGQCTHSCGTGTQTRSRDLSAPSCGGSICPTSLGTQECNTVSCPVDCIVEAWSSWSDCSKTCETGTQSRTRATVSPMHGGKACPTDIQYQSCNTFDCPVDCVEGQWSSFDDCTLTCGTGSRTRTRSIAQPRHGGVSCGNSFETAECNAFACPIDCAFGEWGDWQACTLSCGAGSQTRTRTVNQASVQNGGKACPQSQETQSCGDNCPVDCVSGAWSAWSDCSLTCGSTGSSTRTRHLVQPQFGGALCPVSFESSECARFECPQDCYEVYGWTEWGACSVSCGDGRHTRSRHLQDPQFGGAICGDSLEDRECTDGPCPVHCEVGEWQSWSACDKSCATCLTYGAAGACTSWSAKGYQSRPRSILVDSQDSTLHDGTVLEAQVCPSTTEGRHCNVHECPEDCVIGAWTAWSGCSKTCGTGSQTRTRDLTQEKHGGATCPLGSDERICEAWNCPIDCEVGEYSDWSSCTLTCGGGSQTKTRSLVPPQYGGKICPVSVESRSCNDWECPVDCVEGAWGSHFESGEWVNEPTCSMSCGAGTYTLTRSLIQPQHGGATCGASSKVVDCHHGPCPIHCEVDEFDSWSDCSHTCGVGTQQRTRSITVHFVDGHTCLLSDPDCATSKIVTQANRCPDLGQIRTCNEHDCPQDCVVQAWNEWTDCSLTCGTGSQTRSRPNIAPMYGGKACPSDQETRTCNTFDCPIDCSYGNWDDWSDCSLTCGTGTQTRTRQLQLAQHGGVVCVSDVQRIDLSSAAVETSRRNCNAFECAVDCVVGEWSVWDDCTLSCGTGSQTRTRSTSAPQHGGVACPGASQTQNCNTDNCPVDCVIGQWSGWSDCSLSCGTGGKGRTRSVAAPSFGGKGCPDSIEFQPCNTFECPVDCVEGEWNVADDHTGATCSVTCGVGVYTRTRSLDQPQFGGVECGNAEEVIPCSHGPCPIHCEVNSWSAWSGCSLSCGSGSKSASRQITVNTVDGHHCELTDASCSNKIIVPGTVCPDLSMTSSCNDFACAVDCVQGSWSQWSTCTQSCTSAGNVGLQTRTRTHAEPANGGKACPSVFDSQDCNDFNCPVDCEVGGWSSWSDCTLTCGSGSQTMTRTLVPPTYGGASCPLHSQRISYTNSVETAQRSCNDFSCPVDCVEAQWSAWSSCSLTCGFGTATRTRSIAAPQFGGVACGVSFEDKDCNSFLCPVDCVVGMWNEWGPCSLTCGTGSETRSRTLVEPSHGGALCPSEYDTRHCNTFNCPVDCVEGEWNVAEDHTGAQCTVSCGLGEYTKTRSLVQPLFGGVACGVSKLVIPCNHGPCPIHCEVGSWNVWTDCSHSCGAGSHSRTRQITVDTVDGHHCSLNDEDCTSTRQVIAGTQCPSLLEIQTCNENPCPVDCIVASWNAWGECTQSCQTGASTGSQTRTRTHTEPKYGGKLCPSTFDSRNCNEFYCPVDCSEGAWGSWTPCTLSCGGGTKNRERTFVQPTFGGVECSVDPERISFVGDVETSQTSCNSFSCPEDCEEGQWGGWSSCTLSCAGGSQTATRSLT
jgi:hypothetical protein